MLILKYYSTIITAMRRTTFISLVFLSVFFQGISFSQQAEKPAKTVTAIEIIGNKSISTNVVVSKMRTRIGSPYQENLISDDLKRLYLLGFFSDIRSTPKLTRMV